MFSLCFWELSASCCSLRWWPCYKTSLPRTRLNWSHMLVAGRCSYDQLIMVAQLLLTSTAFCLLLSWYESAMKLWNLDIHFQRPGLHSEFKSLNRWLVLTWNRHFLFNATLVLVADMNRSNSMLEQFVSINERLECIQIAQNMLDQVSSASPQAAIVRLFCRAVGISDTMKVWVPDRVSLVGISSSSLVRFLGLKVDLRIVYCLFLVHISCYPIRSREIPEGIICMFLHFSYRTHFPELANIHFNRGRYSELITSKYPTSFGYNLTWFHYNITSSVPPTLLESSNGIRNQQPFHPSH